MENILPLIVISPVIFFVIAGIREIIVDYTKAPILA
jgi:hypothetical protein